MDRESLGVLQQAAAEAEGLPSSLSDRLVGDSFTKLRADAKKALVDFGIASPQARTSAGQFARMSFSDRIRAAAGRPVNVEREPPVADLGIGKGASATPRHIPAQADMNSLIRAAHGIRVSAEYALAEQIATAQASSG